MVRRMTAAPIGPASSARTTVAATSELAGDGPGAHGPESSTHSRHEGFFGARAALTEQMLDRREGFLYRVEVRGVGR
jgi:hypothetical protein